MKLAKTVDVSGCTTINEVLSRSNTAWEPTTSKLQSTASGPVDTDYHAIVRPDTNEILGICSKRFKPNSHVVHLARLDNMVRNGDLKPERVSIWDRGSLMAFQFRAPSLDAAILPGDTVSPLLTLAFYNDGKHGDMSFFADFRWSCTNQLGRVAEAMEGQRRVAHRGDVHANYERHLSDRILEMSGAVMGRYETMRKMAQKLMNDGTELLVYWASSLAIPESAVPELVSYEEGKSLSHGARHLQAVLGEYREDPTLAPGTVWQAYNAVTRYLTHTVGRNDATRQRRALMGNYQPQLQKAYEDARVLVAA